jgi:DNA-binding transcriptional ArsR family regulator
MKAKAMPSTRKTSQHVDADVFTAIAHPVRRTILSKLLQGEMAARDLAEPFDITRSAISQHLGILVESGLVVREKRGREQVYQLRPENLNEVHRWINQFERFWPERLDALEALLEAMPDDEEKSAE